MGQKTIQSEIRKLQKRLKAIQSQRLKNLGKNIKKRRKELSISQDELAIFANISRTQITNAEAGRSSLSMNSLLFICDALETTPNDLLGYRKED